MKADAPIIFTFAGMCAGYRRTVPLAAGVAIFGIVFGLVAGQKGLSLMESALMSALVFAGASQIMAMDLWTSPAPIVAASLAALVINMRYLLMTAALAPWLKPVGPLRAYGSIFLTADENWAMSIAEFRSGGRDAGFLLGTGLALWTFWVSSTILGRTSGELILAFVGSPERYGLDFVATAVFAALLANMWSGRRDLLPWAAAAVTGILGHEFLPGFWYLLLGGLVGSLVGGIRDVRRP